MCGAERGFIKSARSLQLQISRQRPTVFYKGEHICLLGNVHQDCEKQIKQSHWLKDMRKELCASFLDLLWVHLATSFEL